MSDDITNLLHRAIQSGDWRQIAERLAPESVLHTSNQTGRRRIDGPKAIAAHLAHPGPGTVRDWDAHSWQAGFALSFEWQGVSGVDRRRWYVRTNCGQITELWSTAARPHTGGEAEPTAPPALLAQLRATRVRPLSHGGNSGAALLRAERDDGTAFILKRVGGGASDWLARATGDDGRTAQLHAAGAFDQMPASIGHGIIAVERAQDGAWIAMRDVGRMLLSSDARISREHSRRILRAAADLHRTFRDRAPAGAATLAARIGMSGHAVAEAERPHPDLLPKQFEQGWDAFAEIVDADVADTVLEFVRHPRELADALVRAHGATTLIHGDLRGDNLGFDGEQLVLIDWDLATAGTPGAEFAWFLAHGRQRIDATHDELEADHRAAQGDQLSEPELELGLMSGLVQYGWRIAHSARVHPDPAETAWGRAELAWWVPRVRAALSRVGGPSHFPRINGDG